MQFLNHAQIKLVFQQPQNQVKLTKMEISFQHIHQFFVIAMRTKEFDDALAIIENRFERSIKHIKLRMFSGYNISAFDMFLKGNKVDEIYVPKAYGLNPPTGFDPLPLIQKCTLPVYEINWESNSIVYPIHQLGPLFSN